MKTAGWTDEEAAALSIRSVPFATFVEIHESVAAGLPLEVVLAERGIDLDDWVDADAELAARLCDSANQDASLVDAFDRAFTRARHARDLASADVLFVDLEVFANVLHAVRSHADPPRACADLGVDPARLARAFAHWSVEVEVDGALRRRLADLLVELASRPAPAGAAKARRRPALAAVAGGGVGSKRERTAAPRKRRSVR